MSNLIEYFTLEETAKLWKVTPERILYTLEHFGIDGAAKLGSTWIFPKDLPRPKIKMIPVEKSADLPLPNGRTKLQQCFIDSFNGDGIPMGVYERVIGNTTYRIVEKSAKGANRTLREVMLRRVYREIEEDPDILWSSHDTNAALKKLHKEEVEQQPSLEEYLEGKRKMLADMNFDEEDIKMLLGKYAEYYTPLK